MRWPRAFIQIDPRSVSPRRTCGTLWDSEELDSGLMSAGSGEASVAGDQGDAQGLGERDEGRVVRRQVSAALPHSVRQRMVRVSNERHIGEVPSSLGSSVLGELPCGNQPPECVEELHVEEMGRMEIAVVS